MEDQAVKPHRPAGSCASLGPLQDKVDSASNAGFIAKLLTELAVAKFEEKYGDANWSQRVAGVKRSTPATRRGISG